jgi:hypothetical protein
MSKASLNIDIKGEAPLNPNVPRRLQSHPQQLRGSEQPLADERLDGK